MNPDTGMTHEDLDSLISRFECAVRNGPGFGGDDRRHHQHCWTAVKEIGAAFQTVRYPTGALKHAARQRFQSAVDTLKRQGAQLKQRSAEARYRHIARIEAALPDNGIFSVFEGIVSLPVRAALDAFGSKPADPWKEELLHCQEKLRQAAAEVKTCADLLPADRQAVWERLQQARATLQDHWHRHKEARTREHEARQAEFERRRRERESKQRAWQQAQHERLERLRQVEDKMQNALDRQERHLDDLRDKRDSARSGSYRDRVEQWLEECRGKIADIERSLRDIRSKIRDIEDRLRG